MWNEIRNCARFARLGQACEAACHLLTKRRRHSCKRREHWESFRINRSASVLHRKRQPFLVLYRVRLENVTQVAPLRRCLMFITTPPLKLAMGENSSVAVRQHNPLLVPGVCSAARPIGALLRRLLPYNTLGSFLIGPLLLWNHPFTL